MWSEVSEQVVRYINNKLHSAQEKYRLSRADILVMKAAWEDLKYEEIVSDTEYTISYFQSGIARSLWQLLTKVMGDGEVITKKRFRSFMELRLRTDLGLDPEGREVTGDAVVIGEPPDIMPFYGRKPELVILKRAVKENKLVVLSGLGGIGKTAVAAKLLENVKPKSEGSFDFLIWKSIHYGPTPGSLATELLKFFPQNQREPVDLDSEEFRVTKLIGYLRSNRILLVLDEADSLLQNDGFKSFLRRIIEDPHQSCVLLTSCETFEDIAQLELSNRPVKTIKLGGLAPEEAVEFVKGKGLTITDEWHELINMYQGIPYVIDMITSQVQRLFGGDVKHFFNYKTSLMSDYIQKVFSRELNHNDALSNLKLRIVEHLTHYANKDNLVSFQDLLKGLNDAEDFSILDLKKALEGLLAGSIIEVRTDSRTQEEKYYVNSLVMEYALKGRLTPTSTQSF